MAIFFINETSTFIHYRYLSQGEEQSPEDAHEFAVEVVDDVCERLVEIPPQDLYWDSSANFRDPDGPQIEITREDIYRQFQR